MATHEPGPINSRTRALAGRLMRTLGVLLALSLPLVVPGVGHIPLGGQAATSLVIGDADLHLDTVLPQGYLEINVALTQTQKACQAPLNGHDHDYERFAPQDPAGNADPSNGLTEIIVGTGGDSHFSFNATAANSVVRDNTTFGVLKLTLHPTSFDWQFLPETGRGNGTFTDAGSRACHK